MNHSMHPRARQCALVTLALYLHGCSSNHNEDAGPPPPPTQELSIDLGPIRAPANVYELRLRLTPIVFARADGGIASVLTDNSDRPLVNTCTVNQGAWTCAPDALRDTRLVERTLGAFAPVARKVDIPAGTYASMNVSAISVMHERDSYLILTDGRECEVELRSTSGAEWLSYPFSADAMEVPEGGKRLLIALFDFSTTQIDPNDCAAGYVGARALKAEITYVQISGSPTTSW